MRVDSVTTPQARKGLLVGAAGRTDADARDWVDTCPRSSNSPLEVLHRKAIQASGRHTSKKLHI